MFGPRNRTWVAKTVYAQEKKREAVILTVAKKPLHISPAYPDRLLFVKPLWKMFLWSGQAVI